ncbi:type II toxin-antitoxin system RelE/ParE family toxin [Sphingobacterium psychroaquaticum]|uniref:ParE toxin of type II toxin-antitoxin system, parDE n=1 Tax=Sphingobacterium psychroaquaticum TaxID=561061 RepID=A0A1X7I1H2_9SPHI|nr:ParE toxin of type II toxin-antitoxin system, parDE [Sphingobacterium psychroaquaticum]
MTKYNIRFHKLAEKEYIEAYLWYEEKLKGLGAKFESSVEKKVNLIANNPEQYQIKFNQYRECKIGVFPFVLVFKIYEQLRIVLILAVFHTSKNPINKYRK